MLLRQLVCAAVILGIGYGVGVAAPDAARDGYDAVRGAVTGGSCKTRTTAEPVETVVDAWGREWDVGRHEDVMAKSLGFDEADDVCVIPVDAIPFQEKVHTPPYVKDKQSGVQIRVYPPQKGLRVLDLNYAWY